MGRGRKEFEQEEARQARIRTADERRAEEQGRRIEAHNEVWREKWSRSAPPGKRSVEQPTSLPDHDDKDEATHRQNEQNNKEVPKEGPEAEERWEQMSSASKISPRIGMVKDTHRDT